LPNKTMMWLRMLKTIGTNLFAKPFLIDFRWSKEKKAKNDNCPIY